MKTLLVTPNGVTLVTQPEACPRQATMLFYGSTRRVDVPLKVRDRGN